MVSSSRGVRLPPMPRISDIIRLYGLTAKKQLSQNFILDLNVTGNTVSYACTIFMIYFHLY